MTTQMPQWPSCPALSLPLVVILYLALSLNDHLRVPLSPSAHLAPRPCLFKPEHLSRTWTMSSGAQPLIPQPQPCLFELECSSATSTVSFQA